MAAKKGLGRGLEALFMDNTQEEKESAVQTLKISEIEPNKNQPRKEFDDEALSSLAESIREHGLIQPLTVRPLENGRYQIVAGERRWRASRRAGISEVPVIVMDIDEQTTMELALIENLQREDLNIIEEALGYQELISKYNMTQADVSKSVGKSRSAVANTLRLLNLPEKIKQMVVEGKLSSGHARAILALPSEQAMLKAAEDTVKNELTVRDIEKMAKEPVDDLQKKLKQIKERDSYYDELEIAMKNELRRKVKINAKGEKGSIEIQFFNKDELKDIVEALGGAIKE